MAVGNDDEDRISGLPDDLLYHILSFLRPVEAVRLSLVSKRWRSSWLHIPDLYFDDELSQSMVDYLDNRRRRLCEQQQQQQQHGSGCGFNDYITSLVVKVSSFAGREEEAQNILNSLLNSAFEASATHLNRLLLENTCRDHIDFDYTERVGNYGYTNKGKLKFHLPDSVYNSSSLTSLKLTGIRLMMMKTLIHDSKDPIIIFPSLTSLYLNDVVLDASFFPITFPCLTTLSIDYMPYETDPLQIQNLLLGCPILEDLHFHFNFYDVDYTVCTALRYLELDCFGITTQLIERLVIRLPLLERLALTGVDIPGLEHATFSIHSQTLKSLSLTIVSIRPAQVMKATLNTPNLTYFRFVGHETSIFSIDVSHNMLEAKLSICNRYYDGFDDLWYFNLLQLLSNLKGLHKLWFHVYSKLKEALVIPKHIRKLCSVPLPNLKHLKLTERCYEGEFNDISLLEDALRWCAPSLETFNIGYHASIWN